MRSFVRRSVTVLVLVGSSMAVTPSADARLTWIVTPDKQIGTQTGSTRPCDTAHAGDKGVNHEPVAEGTCWAFIPAAAVAHVNPNAVQPWDETP